MIRYHFGTKDQLWRETVRDMFAQLTATIGDLALASKGGQLSQREWFRRLVQSYVHLCA